MQGTVNHSISFSYMLVEIDFPHIFSKVEGRILKPVLNGQRESFTHNFKMCEFEISVLLRSHTCYPIILNINHQQHQR